MAAPRPTDWDDLVRPSLHGIEPYQPGPSLSELRERYGVDEIVKLNWNEGLFGPFPGALEAAAAELENAWMYPEQAFSDLREAICRWRDVPPEQVVPAHGIQSLVRTVADAFLGPGESVVLPEPTYGLYAQVFAAAGASIEYVPCPELRLDLDEMATVSRPGRRSPCGRLRSEQPDRVPGGAGRVGPLPRRIARGVRGRRGRGVLRVRGSRPPDPPRRRRGRGPAGDSPPDLLKDLRPRGPAARLCDRVGAACVLSGRRAGALQRQPGGPGRRHGEPAEPRDRRGAQAPGGRITASF